MKIKKYIQQLPLLLLLIAVFSCLPAAKANAADASAVSVGKIDYENLTMQIHANGNNMIYYSLDKNTWTEVEGAYNSATDIYTMDISWVSATSDVTINFRGDTVKTIRPVTLPMQDNTIRITFDKIEGDFTFTDMDYAESFEWRKSSDYHWTTVDSNETSKSYLNFLDMVEALRVKGCKIIIRTPQVMGKNVNDVGYRPSKEITITIPARTSAPGVKVNFAKMNLNTTEAMEYYDAATKKWIDCDKAMTLEQIAPGVLFKNGSKDITLLIRIAETERAPYSKTAYIKIPGQAAAPSIGSNAEDATFMYRNSKELVMYFSSASKTNMYQYVIVKDGTNFDATTVSWKSVNSSKIMYFSKTVAPEGSTVYIRKQGIDANASKNIELVLPSATNSYKVSYLVN